MGDANNHLYYTGFSSCQYIQSRFGVIYALFVEVLVDVGAVGADTDVNVVVDDVVVVDVVVDVVVVVVVVDVAN